MSEIIFSFDVTALNVSEDSNIQMFCYVIKQTEDAEAGAILYKCPLDERTKIIIDDVDSAHYIIKIKMDGKAAKDTIYDDDGIIGSAEVKLDNFKFDDFELTELLEKKATYTHDFNKNGEETVDDFSKVLGCNGVVEFDFTTPLYLWLLENMD